MPWQSLERTKNILRQPRADSVVEARVETYQSALRYRAGGEAARLSIKPVLRLVMGDVVFGGERNEDTRI
jgi:hypothetical protein